MGFFFFSNFYLVMNFAGEWSFSVFFIANQVCDTCSPEPLVLGRHYYRIHVITIRVIYLTSQKIHVDQRLFVPIKFMFYKNYCYIT